MQIIPLNFSISRDPETGKKVYTNLNTNTQSMKPSLPKDWQSYDQQPPNQNYEKTSYAIRPDDDLIVVDCDDEASTKAITSLDDSDTYITVSDKGHKHFYYRPTKYFLESALNSKPNRIALDKIDILKGNSLIFTANPANSTKTVFRDNPIQPIPNNIVDHLSSQMVKHITTNTGDYKPVLSYLAPRITIALALYTTTGDYYSSLQSLFSLITPSRYRKYVSPDYHPNRVPDGKGIDYLQALSTKIAGDPSINKKTHQTLITLIAQRLWEDPLSDTQLIGFLSNLTTQTYPDGTPIFQYRPNCTKELLVSSNGQGYTKIYRTLSGEYIVPNPNGGAQIFKSLRLLKETLKSENYSAMHDGKEIPFSYIDKEVPQLIQHIKTATLVDLAHQPPGYYVDDDHTAYYNMNRPTSYLAIIRGTYLQDRTHNTVPPTIKRLLTSITRDHPDNGERMQQLIHEFFSHKLKKLEYSPVVLQFIGKQGTGKDAFINHILGPITSSVGEVDLYIDNGKFNSDYINKMIVKCPEIKITHQVRNIIKKLSGSNEVKSEAKGKDATMIRNVATYVTSSNDATLLAESINDRRFVTISSFTSSRLLIKDLPVMLAMELEDYCLYLRDLTITTPSAYLDAGLWQDEVTLESFTAEAEYWDNKEQGLAILFEQLEHNKIDAVEALSTLKGLVAHWYIKGFKLYILLSVATEIKTNILIDNKLDIRECTKLMKNYRSSDNNVGSRYDKKMQRLVIKLSDKYINVFKSGIQAIESEEIKLN